MFPADFDTFRVDDVELGDGVDPEMAREILFVHSQLDQIDYYQLFGVERDADRREIKRSYYQLSKRFHPDKYFRDRAGQVSERVEKIFKFVTKAYNTLSKKQKRAEYDRALGEAQARAEHDAADDRRRREMAAELLARRAAQLEQQGDLVGAAAELRKVASLTREPEVLLKAATLLLRANMKLDEAASFARAALQQLGESVEARLVLGQIYERNRMFAEAQEAFEQAKRVAPGDPSIQVHLERLRSQLD
jgi:curved DNA-binding protein CbpA